MRVLAVVIDLLALQRRQTPSILRQLICTSNTLYPDHPGVSPQRRLSIGAGHQARLAFTRELDSPQYYLSSKKLSIILYDQRLPFAKRWKEVQNILSFVQVTNMGTFRLVDSNAVWMRFLDLYRIETKILLFHHKARLPDNPSGSTYNS